MCVRVYLIQLPHNRIQWRVVADTVTQYYCLQECDAMYSG
jgi:hypothetical protein